MSVLSEIVTLFGKNNNGWLNYNEIYNRLDGSLFGDNKHGDQGKAGMVSGLLSRNQHLFDVDENEKPKRYRLKIDGGNLLTNSVNITKSYATDNKLIVNGTEYMSILYGKESDFEEEVEKNYKLIFGENSIYNKSKKRLGDRICDGFAYNKDTKRLIIVENELCSHDLWIHIIPQIVGFFIALKNPDTKDTLKYKIDWDLTANEKNDLIYAVDTSNFDIVVVIDKITFDIDTQRDAINKLASLFSDKKQVNIVFKEFKIFENLKGERIYEVT